MSLSTTPVRFEDCFVVPYSVPLSVSNAKKILAKMRKNPRDWRMEDLDLEVVARRFGVDVEARQAQAM